MKLTWSDIEAHRTTLTATEWRRLSAYLREGQEPFRIAQVEGALRENSEKLAYTALIDSLGRGSLKVLLSLLKGTLTWTELEAHRCATTPEQWTRIRVFVYECKPLSRLARQEGRPPGASTYTLRLSIGRGCLALFSYTWLRSQIESVDLSSRRIRATRQNEPALARGSLLDGVKKDSGIAVRYEEHSGQAWRLQLGDRAAQHCLSGRSSSPPGQAI